LDFSRSWRNVSDREIPHHVEAGIIAHSPLHVRQEVLTGAARIPIVPEIAAAQVSDQDHRA
jgi:hypothetical protein